MTLTVPNNYKYSDTYVANKALNMPLPLEGGDDVVDNGFVAAATFRGKHLVVISLAVGFTFKHVVPGVILF